MTLTPIPRADRYELCDAKRLLKVLNFVINETLPDGDSNQSMMFALIDAIEEKIDAAEKAIDGKAP